MSRRPLFIIWLVFTALFFVLAGFSAWAALSSTPRFVYVWADDAADMRVINSLMLSDEFKSFVTKFNDFIDTQDRSSMYANLLAAVGYLAAGFTAAISAYIDRPQKPVDINT